MKILAIDTSCDETSVALIENDRVISNKLSSQIDSHQEWGGVVPSLAKRKHEELIDPIISLALKTGQSKIEDIDVFAVTVGPGLAIALEVGIRKAKELSIKYKKPLIAVNHMEGHIYSTFAKNSNGNPVIEYKFPLLVLLISGGHSEFVLMKDHGVYEILGQTLDDAMGESFDKVGRMLDLGYPAGQVIEKIAKLGNENKYVLPIPMLNSRDANMSYSGLKTASMKLINDELKNPLNKYAEKFKTQVQSSNSYRKKESDNNLEINEKQVIADIAASFQKAAVEQVLLKTDFVLNKIIDNLNIEDIAIGGGVSQNLYLRKKFKQKFGRKYRIHYPTNKKLYTDNAGMIGIAGYHNALRNNFVKDIDSLDRKPNWRIDMVE